MGSAGLVPRASSRSSSPLWLAACVVCILFAVLATINIELLQRGYASKNLLYLGEKALLVFYGEPPRLENLGFVYPPLPYLFVLLFRNPFWASAFVGALVAWGFLLVVWKAFLRGYISWWFFLVVLVYLCISPLSLYLLSQHIQLCLVIALLMQIYYHLYRYLRRQLSFDLFVFGLLTGLLFYAEFLTVFVIPLLLAAVLLGTAEYDWKQRAAILMTGFFPAVFLSSSWCYINWLFMKDPLYFLRQWHSTFNPELLSFQTVIAAYDAWEAAKLGAKLCARYTLLILPYWVVLGGLFMKGSRMRFLSLTVLLTPPWLLFLLILGGNYEFNASYFILFLTTAFLVKISSLRELNRLWFDKVLVGAVIVSLLASFQIPLTQDSVKEHQFTIGLLNRRACANLTPYQNILNRIDTMDPDATILLDDTQLFPLVLLDGRPKRFILPYQYEFGTVLSAPQFYVDYLIIPEHNPLDLVGSRFPLARFGYAKHYQLVERFDNLLLFRRSFEYSLTAY